MSCLRSRLFTPCPWHAIAEWLVKAYRPIGFPPGSRPGDGELVLKISGNSFVVDHVLLSSEAIFIANGCNVRTIKIRTEIQSQLIEAHYSAGSSPVYIHPDYNKAILKMKDKLERYCLNNIDVCYVLSQIAANDHLHPFWKSRLFNRTRGLSY